MGVRRAPPLAGTRPPDTAAPAATCRDAASPAELAAWLGVLLTRLQRRGRHQRGGLSASQLSALVAIEGHRDVRVGDLALIEGIGAPTMTRIVAGLVEAGLVARHPDPADGRSVRVALTAAGAGRLNELRRETTPGLIRAIERLDAGDYQRLADALPVLESLLDETSDASD